MNEIAAKQGRDLSWPGREAVAALLGAALIVIADVLFWQHEPGISLFVFFVAVDAALLILAGGRAVTAAAVGAAGIAILGAVPLIEAPTLWGWLAAAFGTTILALSVRRQLPRRATDLPLVLVRFGILTPVRLLADSIRFAIRAAEHGLGKRLVRAALMWVVPLVLALIFAGLFTAANPVIEDVLRAINVDSVLDLLSFWRIVSWGMVAVFVWPFLRPRLLRLPRVAAVQGPVLPRAESLIFGRGAILRALILFNGLFAIQTGLDLTYLWGGVSLPDGMTYADYAHRGAYPLIATALLAAAFVLAAMRPGGAAEQSKLIRNLVYLFMAQNVMLVVSSILRLDLYVEVYSLTGLRVAAGIWMGLVAAGLLLILCRIAFRRSNKWLIATNLLVLGSTLYVCAWLDFSAMISGYNVQNADYAETHGGSSLDVGYLRELGPASIPAIDGYLRAHPAKPESRDLLLLRLELASNFINRSRDWQSWSFQLARLDDYLAGNSLDEFADIARSIGPEQWNDPVRDTATMPPEPDRPASETMP